MLNIPRVNMRQAVNYAEGIRCAHGGYSFAMFDAVAMSEEEAELLEDDAIARRALAEAKREVME